MIVVWAARLGSYLVARVMAAGADARFDPIKPSFARFLLVWTMQGLAGRSSDPDDPQVSLMSLFEEAGYVGVVATNCEQTYRRYLHPGDLLTVSSTLESISGLKKTALGEGYFVTTLQTFRDQLGEVVGEMRFRILKFRPARAGGADGNGQETTEAGEVVDAPPAPIDSAFFWEGLEAGELRVQRCVACGRLRHPPRPMCPSCRSLERDHVVASGRGEVYTFVVHHYPPVPDRDSPFVVALVELEEGTRIVGNVVDVEPGDVRVGLPVEVAFVNDGDRTLPQWRPLGGGR